MTVKIHDVLGAKFGLKRLTGTKCPLGEDPLAYC